MKRNHLARNWYRYVTSVILLIGFAALPILIILDLAGRFDKYPFITNVVSNIIGAFIGVPTAIFFTRRIYSRIDTNNRENAALTLKRSRAESITALYQTLFYAPRECLEDRLHSIVKALSIDLYSPAAEKASFEIIRAYATYKPRPDALRGFLSQHLPALQEASGLVENELGEIAQSIYATWSAFIVQWDFICGQLKSQLLSADLPWLDAFEEAEYGKVLSSNPYQSYFDFVASLQGVVEKTKNNINASDEHIDYNVLYDIESMQRNPAFSDSYYARFTHTRATLGRLIDYMNS